MIEEQNYEEAFNEMITLSDFIKMMKMKFLSEQEF